MTRTRWPFWALLAFWAGVLWLGWQTHQAVKAVMEPTINAVQSVSKLTAERKQ